MRDDWRPLRPLVEWVATRTHAECSGDAALSRADHGVAACDLLELLDESRWLGRDAARTAFARPAL